MTTWAIILAAGQGSRLAEATGGARKQFLMWRKRPLFWHAARTFARVPRLFGLVFVFPESDFLTAQETVIDLDSQDELGLPWLCVTGGARRQDSVACGLQALPPDCDAVLVHDGARPFASAALCNSLLDALEAGAQAAIPALPVPDTIKRVTPEGDLVTETLQRRELRAVQTPQAFSLSLLRQAHQRAATEGWEVTDDASMVEQLGLSVATVPGEERNVKITTPADLELLADPAPAATAALPVTGWGYDVHRYVPADAPKARPLKFGGVPVPSGQSGVHVQAHSDGDVLLHALTDALLGCIGEGDIGDRFPDSDPAWENANSAVLLDAVLQDCLARGLAISHVDCTIIAQVPKIGPHKRQIRESIARLLHLPPARVNVKATTEEGLGFTGSKHGVKAVAVVTGQLAEEQPRSDQPAAD